MIRHIYSHLYCSSSDGGRDLQSSGEAAPTIGQVPCKFQADQTNFIFQLVPPDMIGHIYSHLYCSLRDGGRHLLSSGEAASTIGKVPCESGADWPGCSFSGGRVETRVLPALPCPGWCTNHGWWLRTWFGTFTHTCTAHQGMVAGTCHLHGRWPLPWGRSSVSFEQIGQPSLFSWWLLMWFGTFTQTCTAPRGMMVGTCHLQGRQPLPWGRSPVGFEQIDQTSFFSQQLLMRFGTFYSVQHCFKGVLGMDLLSSGDDALMMGQVPCEFWGDWPTFIFSASGSWHDSAHLLWVGLKVWTCHLQGMLHSPLDLQGTFPRPRNTSPEDGKWMAPSPIEVPLTQLPPKNWIWANLLKTQRGPAPW